MSSQRGRRGRSKADWLEAALEVLRTSSIHNLTVERIAAQLGIAKSGFYWHFENRDELLEAVLDYWIHETTEIAATNVDMLKMEPKSRLVATAEMILKFDLARYDIPIRQWAMEDKRAEKAVRKVNKLRFEYIRTAFAELGFTGEDLELRARLFTVYQSFEGPGFPELSKRKRKDLILQRVELLTAKTPAR